MSIEKEVLENLPKQTPKWAVGTVAIIIALLTGMGGFYLVAQDSIKSYVEGSVYKSAAHEELDEKRFTTILDTILTLTRVNSQQIVDLSRELGNAQEENKKLAARVAALEKSLDISDTKLKDCEEKLLKNKR
jgi:uncharacterized protein HemX